MSRSPYPEVNPITHFGVIALFKIAVKKTYMAMILKI
jgi:hypothetical protein